MRQGCGTLFKSGSGIIICGENRVDGNKFLCHRCLSRIREDYDIRFRNLQAQIDLLAAEIKLLKLRDDKILEIIKIGRMIK